MSDRAKLIKELRALYWSTDMDQRAIKADLAGDAAAQIEADGRLEAEVDRLKGTIKAHDAASFLDGHGIQMHDMTVRLAKQQTELLIKEEKKSRGLEAENGRLRAALCEIAVPLHDLAGNATLMREIARKALNQEVPNAHG